MGISQNILLLAAGMNGKRGMGATLMKAFSWKIPHSTLRGIFTSME
jgi:hypothetical protein